MFKEGKHGGKKNFELTVVRDTEKIEWLPLTRDNQELQLAELIELINRMVFRAFGVTPTSMGDMKNTNRATAQVEENIDGSRLIIPYIKSLEEYVNSQIVHMHFFKDVKWVINRPKNEDLRLIIEKAKLVDKGILSINEQRKMLGEKATDFGDRYTILLGNQIFELTKTGLERLTPEPVAPEPFGNPKEDIESKPPENPKGDDSPKDEESDFETEKRYISLTKDNGEKKTDLEIAVEYVTKYNPKTIDVHKALSTRDVATKKMDTIWTKKKNSVVSKIVKAYPNIGQVKKAIDAGISELLAPTTSTFKEQMLPAFKDGISKAVIYDKKINPSSEVLRKKFEELVMKDVSTSDKNPGIIKKYLFYGDRGYFNKMLNTVSDFKDKNEKLVKKADRKIDAELALELEKVYETFKESRLKNYGAKTWAYAHSGLLDALSVSKEKENEMAWLVNTSDDVCETCSFYSQKAYPVNDFPYIPVSGDSECKQNCLCIIEVSKNKPPISFAGIRYQKR